VNKKIKNICCLGAGYVGGPTMAVIAFKCSHIIVNVVDTNQQRVDAWNANDLNKLPIFEPGLDKIIAETRNKNLFFSTKIEKNISNADIIFISVNTPTKTKGLGAGKASDLKWIELCARQVAKFAIGHTIVIEKSTLPVRTAEVIKQILNESQSKYSVDKEKKTFDILSNPEFLAEGSAIQDLLNPDRVLIGGDNKKAIDSLSEIYENWIVKEKILHTNLWSSELAKLTANAFLAQRISSINTISVLCEKTGANVKQVSKAIGLDHRIGNKFLDAGPGFGGSCFQKDLLNLVYLSESLGLNEVAEYWNQVIEINNWQRKRISKLIIEKLFGTVGGKKIGILGFSFKANTNDTRESSAIQISRDLLEEGAFLIIHDPKVNIKDIEYYLGPNQKRDMQIDSETKGYGCWSFTDNLEKIYQDSDALVVITEWSKYSQIKWDIASKNMRRPGWVFDTRGIINIDEVKKNGLKIWVVGNGEL
tara:strand:+ start:1517 stop:2947 length:1431 start_codon:yes stop_codon:yes gene_type:complete